LGESSISGEKIESLSIGLLDLVLRIIAGKYRGRRLKSPPTLETRPTSDRLRETLFNVIAPQVCGARFLDLCAGSGAVGIEALSRGAAHATFVDRSRKMRGLIESNLELCRIPDEETEVITTDIVEFLRKIAKGKSESWELVFFDPPYADDHFPVLELFSNNDSELLSDEGMLIVEHHHKTELPDVLGGIRRTRILKQGDSALSFYGSINPGLLIHTAALARCQRSIKKHRTVSTVSSQQIKGRVRNR
jgi:16S rRNA (guanine966-N2)-methyltransferase